MDNSEKSQFTGKDPGKDWRQKEKRAAEDEMVREHHWLSVHESEQTPGDSEGQGSLVCCSPWGRKEPDRTEWLNHSKHVEMDREAWRAAIHGVTKRRTQLSDWTELNWTEACTAMLKYFLKFNTMFITKKFVVYLL